MSRRVRVIGWSTGALLVVSGLVLISDSSGSDSRSTTTFETRQIVIKLPAQPTELADRVGNIYQETPSITSAPQAVGLYGLPFAPVDLSDCDEMNYYRVQFGLPDKFATLGWRESNCRNEVGVKTWCCYGYWQLYFKQHMSDHRMEPKYARCGVDQISDYNGDEPLDKQKQACAAKALYDTVGYSAWSATL